MSSRNPPARSPAVINKEKDLDLELQHRDEALANLPPVRSTDYLSAMFLPAEGDFTAPLPSRSPPASPLGKSRPVLEVEARFESKLADMDAHSAAVNANLYALYEHELQRLRAIYRLRNQSVGNFVQAAPILHPADEEVLLANLMADPREMEHRYRFYKENEQRRRFYDPYERRQASPPPQPPPSYEIAKSEPGGPYGEWPHLWTSNNPPPDVETYEFMSALRCALKEIDSYAHHSSAGRAAVVKEATEEKARVLARQKAKEFAEAQAKVVTVTKNKTENNKKTGGKGGAGSPISPQTAEQSHPGGSGIKLGFNIKGLAKKKEAAASASFAEGAEENLQSSTPTTPQASIHEAAWEQLLASTQQKMLGEKKQEGEGNSSGAHNGAEEQERKKQEEERKRKRNSLGEGADYTQQQQQRPDKKRLTHEDKKAARRKEAEEHARRYKAELAANNNKKKRKSSGGEPWRR